MLQEKYQQGFATEPINSWNKLNLDKIGRPDPTSKYMDIQLLKLTALVVCRGSHSEKAAAFVELLVAHFAAKYREDIYFENVQFARAIRFIFYFNIILPRKFLVEHRDQEVFMDVLFH